MDDKNNAPVNIDPQRERLMAHLANVQTVRVNSFRQFMERIAGTILNATSQNLDYYLKQTKNLLYVITQVTAAEDTNAPTRIELSIVRGGNEYQLTSAAPAAASASVEFSGQAIAAPGDTIRAKFVGGTSTNAIRLNVHGYTIEG